MRIRPPTPKARLVATPESRKGFDDFVAAYNNIIRSSSTVIVVYNVLVRILFF